MNAIVKEICKNEGFTTVKEFRSFFEYYIIGWGELDNDFSSATKRISKNKTVAQWKKWYKEITDEEIAESLASKEESEEADVAFKARIEADRESDNQKSEEQKKAENETALQMQDAGIEYDPSVSWEENVEKYAENPEAKKDEIKKYSGYGYHGGGRPSKGEQAKSVTVSISGTQKEIDKLRGLAAENNKTVSRFVIEMAKNKIIEGLLPLNTKEYKIVNTYFDSCNCEVAIVDVTLQNDTVVRKEYELDNGYEVDEE